MTRKKDVWGRCSICEKQGKLSFEHVPNQAAYNQSAVIEYSWENVLVKKENFKGKIIQGGIGEYTLCESCNNDTGHWYGGEYTRWAKSCFAFLMTHKSSLSDLNEATIKLHNVYPLRFLKQVVVMFFSVTPGLARTYPKLQKYVLDKQETQLPEGCRFYLNFYFGTRPILKRWPLAGKISVRVEGNQIIPISSSIISEMAHPPFAIIMAEDNGFLGAGEITSFTRCGYNQMVKEVTLKLRILKGESALPGGFQ
ncbi:MAG: hypothetical protein ABIF04_00480 [Chloroflexota bacterium]